MSIKARTARTSVHRSTIWRRVKKLIANGWNLTDAKKAAMLHRIVTSLPPQSKVDEEEKNNNVIIHAHDHSSSEVVEGRSTSVTIKATDDRHLKGERKFVRCIAEQDVETAKILASICVANIIREGDKQFTNDSDAQCWTSGPSVGDLFEQQLGQTCCIENELCGAKRSLPSSPPPSVLQQPIPPQHPPLPLTAMASEPPSAHKRQITRKSEKESGPWLAVPPPVPPLSRYGRKRSAKTFFGDAGEQEGPARKFYSEYSVPPTKPCVTLAEEQAVPPYCIVGASIRAVGWVGGAHHIFMATVVGLRERFPKIVVKYTADETGAAHTLMLPSPRTAYVHAGMVEPLT